MAFIRIKIVKGMRYYYLVESVREGKKVKQKIKQYFGTTLPEGYVVPKAVVSKAVVVPSVSPQTVSTTPPQTNLSLTRGRGEGKEPAEQKQRASPTHTPIHSEGGKYRNYTYPPISQISPTN